MSSRSASASWPRARVARPSSRRAWPRPRRSPAAPRISTASRARWRRLRVAAGAELVVQHAQAIQVPAFGASIARTGARPRSRDGTAPGLLTRRRRAKRRCAGRSARCRIARSNTAPGGSASRSRAWRAARLDHGHDVGQLALEPAEGAPVGRRAAPRFGQLGVVLGQTRQRPALGRRRQRQVGADEAARDGVQLVAAAVVGGRAADFQQRRFEQLVQGHARPTRRRPPAAWRDRSAPPAAAASPAGRALAAAGRRPRRRTSRRRLRLRRAPAARGRARPSGRGAAGRPPSRPAAGSARRRPAGCRSAWRSRTRCPPCHDFGQRAAHLGRALALGFGEQQLAHGVGGQRLGHQRADFAGQPATAGDQRATTARQIGQERQHRRIAAIDVVDQQQHGASAEQVAHGLAAILERARQQARVVERARHRLEERAEAAAVAARDPDERVEQRHGDSLRPDATGCQQRAGGLARVGDRVQQRRLARTTRALDADDRAARLRPASAAAWPPRAGDR